MVGYAKVAAKAPGQRGHQGVSEVAATMVLPLSLQPGYDYFDGQVEVYGRTGARLATSCQTRSTRRNWSQLSGLSWATH